MPPESDPVISGFDEDQWAAGDTLELNCTSAKSHPAAQLQWSVHGRLVSAIPHHSRTRILSGTHYSESPTAFRSHFRFGNRESYGTGRVTKTELGSHGSHSEDHTA